ncbi:MAG: TIR domain-containing protein [Hyphomonas sp.]
MGVIFISHSSRNNAEAIAVRDWLRAEGYAETFLDLDPEHGLAPGQRWEEELQKAGERCLAVVVLISPDWCASKWCFHEFKFAKALGKKIFPVLIKPTIWSDLPQELVSHFQMADISLPERREDGLIRLRFGLQRAGLDPRHFSLPAGRPPYRGLKALEEEDAAVFFGRDAQITAGLDALRQMRSGTPQRILTIAAASGAGKSSFLRAGLIARLKRDEENFLVLPIWRPGRDALGGETGLLRAFGLPAAGASPAPYLARKQAEVTERFQALARAANEAGHATVPTLVLPLDQAEELFSAENHSAGAAIDLLLDSLEAVPDLVMIATIRSDSLGNLQADSRLAQQLKLFNLPALPPAAFKEVIEGPARLASPPIVIEPALTERLMADLHDKDALPLLAFTLERLVEGYADDHLIELSEYEEGLGGLDGAISAAVSAAMRRAAADPALPSGRMELDALARSAFIPWLVQLDEADASPKRRVARMQDIPEAARPLVLHFVSERLLVAGEAGGETTVEVSHEAVLRHWHGLVQWISDERITLEGLSRILRSAADWRRSEAEATARSEEFLFHKGDQLKAAEALLLRPDMAQALQPALAYLHDCRAAENAAAEREQRQAEREQRQRKRVGRWQLVAGIVLLIGFAGILGASGWIAVAQRELQKGFSEILVQESRKALAEDRTGRAFRFAVLASRDNPLAPASQHAQFHLGAAALQLRRKVELGDGTEGFVAAEVDPETDRILILSNKGRLREWTESSDGTWSPRDLLHQYADGSFDRFTADGKPIPSASQQKPEFLNPAWIPVFLEGHGDWVRSAAFSPDGARIVTASDDGTARVWHRTEDGWDSTPLEGHGDWVRSAAFSPDGARIVTASGDGTARVWRQTEDGWNSTPLEGHGGTVFSAAFSPDGARIVTASDDGTARVWLLTRGGEWVGPTSPADEDWIASARFFGNHKTLMIASQSDAIHVWTRKHADEWITSDITIATEGSSTAGISADGQSLAVGFWDGNITLWRQSAASNDWNSFVLGTHEDGVSAVAFSPGGRAIVTASVDGAAKVWHEEAEGRWRSTPLEGNESIVDFAAFSADGHRIVTASEDKTARIWQPNAGGVWTSQVLGEHTADLRYAGFSPDGLTVFTETEDDEVFTWQRDEWLTWQRVSETARKQRSSPDQATSDGRLIVHGTTDGTAQILRKDRDGRWHSRSVQGHGEGPVTPSVFSDGKRAVLLTSDGKAVILDLDSHGSSETVPGSRMLNHAYTAAFSPDGSRIVTGMGEGTGHIWQKGQDGSWQGKVLSGHEVSIASAGFAADGRTLVTASSDNIARLWRETEFGDWVSLDSLRHDAGVYAAAFSPVNMDVVTASGDKSARLWQASDDGTYWSLSARLEHDGEVFSADFSPDGRRIVTASADRKVRIWRRTGDMSWENTSLEGHSDWVRCVDYAPDGKTIVSGSYDGTIRIWQSGGAGTWESSAVYDQGSIVYSCRFSPDGQHIVTATADHKVHVWTRHQDDEWRAQSLSGHSGPVRTAAFSPDSRTIVSASFDGAVNLWDQNNAGNWTPDSLAIPTIWRGSVHNMSQSGSLVTTFGNDDKIRIARLNPAGAWSDEVLVSQAPYPASVAISPDDRTIFTAFADRTGQVWRQDEAGDWSASRLDTPGEWIEFSVISRDGRMVVTQSQNARVMIRQQNPSGDWQEALLDGASRLGGAFSVSSDGQMVAAITEDAKLEIWQQAPDGAWQSRLLEGHSGAVTRAAFSPDSETLLTSGNDRMVLVWRRDIDGTWKSAALEGQTGIPHTAEFSADSREILTAADEPSVRIWREEPDGSWKSTMLEGHTGNVRSARFSPDGRWVVTASSDGAARIWRRDKKELWDSIPLKLEGDSISYAQFARDGASIVASLSDGTLNSWDIAWLWDDPRRQRWNTGARGHSLASAISSACRLAGRNYLDADQPGSSPLSLLTEEDFGAAPFLTTMGFKPGDDVCALVKPKGLDALLTHLLPRHWWSGLDWGE